MIEPIIVWLLLAVIILELIAIALIVYAIGFISELFSGLPRIVKGE